MSWYSRKCPDKMDFAMNQSLNNLVLKVEKFSTILVDKGFGQIQQVTSSPHVMCFQCRVPGKTVYLYIGRGVVYQGFDFGTNKVPAFLRTQDKFLQFARKNWRGMQLIKISSSDCDRVLCLEGKMGPYQQKAFFFWRGRDLFFANLRLDNQKAELFTSWEGKRNLDLNLGLELEISTIFSELGYGTVEFGQQKSKDFNFSEYLEEFDSIGASASKKTKDQKTIEKMTEELKRFDDLAVIEKFKETPLEDLKVAGEGRFKVSFRGLEGHYKKREYLFDKIKGWRKSKARLEERIASLNLRLEGSKNSKKELDRKFKTVQPIWKVEKNKVQIKKKSDHIEFTYKDWRCFLGRNAHENDFIRKEKAKKDDWWLHLEGMKSGHLIVKTEGKTPDQSDLVTLGSALVELCGQEYSDIPLVFTQVKNLKGVKGVPGSVTFKKEKHLKVIYDQEWRQNLTFIE